MVRPRIALAEDSVVLGRPPADVVELFRSRMRSGPEVVAASEDAVVRSFSGRAGAFPYHTVEIVRFEATAVTFEHLRGPFATCDERFDLTPTGDGSRLTHSGTFTLRGGLFTWPLAVGPVKRAFERHVQEHMADMADELAAER